MAGRCVGFQDSWFWFGIFPGFDIWDSSAYRSSEKLSSLVGINVGALTIRIGFWVVLIAIMAKNTPKP